MEDWFLIIGAGSFLYLVYFFKSKKEKIQRYLMICFLVFLFGLSFFVANDTDTRHQAFEDYYQVDDYEELMVRPMSDGFYEVYINSGKELIFYNEKEDAIQVLQREYLKYGGIIASN